MHIYGEQQRKRNTIVANEELQRGIIEKRQNRLLRAQCKKQNKKEEERQQQLQQSNDENAMISNTSSSSIHRVAASAEGDDDRFIEDSVTHNDGIQQQTILRVINYSADHHYSSTTNTTAATGDDNTTINIRVPCPIKEVVLSQSLFPSRHPTTTTSTPNDETITVHNTHIRTDVAAPPPPPPPTHHPSPITSCQPPTTTMPRFLLPGFKRHLPEHVFMRNHKQPQPPQYPSQQLSAELNDVKDDDPFTFKLSDSEHNSTTKIRRTTTARKRTVSTEAIHTTTPLLANNSTARKRRKTGTTQPSLTTANLKQHTQTSAVSGDHCSALTRSHRS
jgi:hypothetical protein